VIRPQKAPILLRFPTTDETVETPQDPSKSLKTQLTADTVRTQELARDAFVAAALAYFQAPSEELLEVSKAAAAVVLAARASKVGSRLRLHFKRPHVAHRVAWFAALVGRQFASQSIMVAYERYPVLTGRA